ncbi:MAG: hypothetical protein NTV33_03290, partial [Coprothermobacterota bacterium]|nr:hypothetical protein [Coprothermobacterota bacterium]
MKLGAFPKGSEVRSSVPRSFESGASFGAIVDLLANFATRYWQKNEEGEMQSENPDASPVS